MPRANFNPHSPCGEGPRHPPAHRRWCGNFNPPSPCGEGRKIAEVAAISLRFQSTLPMRGGTIKQKCLCEIGIISIHPPHAGRDWYAFDEEGYMMDFNPPSPCGEGRDACRHHGEILRFQSTLPMRGGTPDRIRRIHGRGISIHPPHAGRDGNDGYFESWQYHFNPPSPCGEGRPCWRC